MKRIDFHTHAFAETESEVAYRVRLRPSRTFSDSSVGAYYHRIIVLFLKVIREAVRQHMTL